jgi:hypothetical protein
MNHRSKLLALIAVAAVAGLGVFVSSGVGGDNSAPTAESIDLTVAEPKTVSADELKLVDTGRLPGRGASASRKSAKLYYFLSVETFTVAPNTADLREIRCPVKLQPAAGGVFAPAPGLAVTNSSRTNPIPGGPTLSGAWYEQVTNFTGVPLTWRVHLTCVGK